MKVPGSVRDAYQQCVEARTGMKDRVDALVVGRKPLRWHYESRVKELVSFALKLETGRVADPLRLEDFFACTIVVENHRTIGDARKLVEDLFVLKKVRPPTPGKTWKKPSDFAFDDLRMYVQWREDPAQPQVAFAGITFEVQIKTFLQHAWGIATHDLVYKTDRFSWPLQRVAFEIKAMLEHAEISIERAEDLATTDILGLNTNEFASLQEIIDFLAKHWPASALPTDRCRLASTVSELLRRLEIGLPLLDACLQAETAAGHGARTLDLSPYGVLIQSLLNQKPEVFEKLRRKNPEDKFRVFLPREIAGRDAVASKAPTRVVTL